MKGKGKVKLEEKQDTPPGRVKGHGGEAAIEAGRRMFSKEKKGGKGKGK